MGDSSIYLPTNEFQTSITDRLIDSLPQWVREQFLDFVANVPLISWMISPDRPRAKDLPRDEDGKIIVDIAHPHILEDTDYFRPSARHFEEHGCYTFLKPNPNPKSEYGKWFMEEVRRCREGYVRQSDGEWVTGFMYYYLNYCPIKVTKTDPKTGISAQVPGFPAFWEGVYYRYHYIDQARRASKHCIELARRGAGKAHPYYEKVITPDGEKCWGDIQVGDRLFGDDGAVTTITDIPFDGVCPTYRITLRDGRKIYASEGHLWRVKVHNRKEEKVLSTKELLGIYIRERKVSERNPSGIEFICGISSNKFVEFESATTQVDPYTFGVLLGDGCFRHRCCYLSENEEDFYVIRQHIPYKCVRWPGVHYGYRIAVPRWNDILKDYGLYYKKSEDKFIPDEYKYNTKEVRLAVLKGLIDTDGFLDKQKVYCISTSSKRLAEDIRWICWSLGYNNNLTVKKAGYKKEGVYKQCLDSYQVSIYTTDVLTNLPRKMRGNWSSNYAKSRAVQSRIINIEYVGYKQSKCVTVDNASHCYLIGDFVITHNSFSLASIMDHNLHLGENEFSKAEVNTILCGYTTEYLSQKDGTLSKFVKMKDFVAKNTEFPRLLSTNRPSDMLWVAGSKDPSTGVISGSQNAVMGVAVKDDESKVRGKRGFILFEEMGSFRNLLQTYNNVRNSVRDGNKVFAEIYLVGTAGDKDSDFSGAREILYNPEGYEIYPLENVYDLEGKGRNTFGYFFPSYISSTGFIDKDGNSDVVAALLYIINNRDKVRRTKPETLLSVIAQDPITPEEAILRVRKGYFPTDMLNERLRQIDQNPRFYDDVYVGTLVDVKGRVEFRLTDDTPIRDWPIKKTNMDISGALEVYKMPPEGEIPVNRYILGIDPIENDKEADSESLFSCIMFDLFTDEIVAEYTGRKELNDDNCRMAWLMCRFWNAKAMPEANKKNVYTYFATKHSLQMLADCPEYLKEKEIVKYSTTGTSSKGVQALPAVISLAQDLLRDWLLTSSVEQYESPSGELETVETPNVMKLRGRALLKEFLSYGPGSNTDRVSALMQVMLYRQQYQILYGERDEEDTVSDDEDDEFFRKDWQHQMEIMSRLGYNNSTLED